MNAGNASWSTRVQSVDERHVASHLTYRGLRLAGRRGKSACARVLGNGVLQHLVRLGLGVIRQAMREILRDVHPVAASHHCDPDRVVLGTEDVGAMWRRIH